MENFNILISPLDWGLGHTTRIIPIIETLQNKNYNVTVAVCAKQKKLLEQELNKVHFVDLNGYNISYANNKFLFYLKILLQIPKIFWKIYKENKWLKSYISNNKIDLIISDNRFGFYHKSIKSIFITHQLLIKTGNSFAENILQNINYHFINKFDECWVPDFDEEVNIAGDLSHPKKLPKTKIKYIGALSRFEKTDIKINYDLCVLLSGPEPQRSLLEKKLLKQLSSINNKNILFVRGLPNSNEKIVVANLHIKNHLQGIELNEAICCSKFILARSGYTTIMELISLQKPMILIPTPMQTEQEYLAKYLAEKNICINCNQKNIDVGQVLEKAENFDFNFINVSNKIYL